MTRLVADAPPPTLDSPKPGRSRRRASWAVMALLLVVALAVGAQGRRRPLTLSQRVERLTTEIRCPTCQGLSAAVSDAPAARAIRDEVRRRLADGQSEEEVKAALVASYGPGLLLKPEARGVGLLVWVLPVLAIATTLAVLAAVLARRRRTGPAPAATSPPREAADREAARPGRRAADRRRSSRRVSVGVALGIGAVALTAVALLAGERRGDQPASGSVPPGATAGVGEALALEREGKALEALKRYDSVLAEDPDNVEALAYRGWLLKRAGLVDEALVTLDRAVQVDPRYPDAHFFRGMLLYQDRSDPAGAVEEFRAFLANDPPPAMVPAVTEVMQRAAAEAAARP